MVDLMECIMNGKALTFSGNFMRSDSVEVIFSAHVHGTTLSTWKADKQKKHWRWLNHSPKHGNCCCCMLIDWMNSSKSWGIQSQGSVGDILSCCCLNSHFHLTKKTPHHPVLFLNPHIFPGLPPVFGADSIPIYFASLTLLVTYFLVQSQLRSLHTLLGWLNPTFLLLKPFV